MYMFPQLFPSPQQCYFTTLIKPAVEGREQHVVSFLGYSLGQAPALRFSFEGDTVVKFLKSREFDLRERLDLMLQIIEAVEDLHTLRAGAHSAEDEPSMYCVHCDLKPENIMIKTLSNPGLNGVIAWFLSSSSLPQCPPFLVFEK